MLDRTAAPSFVKTSTFNLLTPEEFELSNGLHVFLVPGGFQDVMKIEFVFEAGRWFEQKTAAAYFTSQLLSKGTRHKSSYDIAQLFDQYGAHLEISPGLDYVSISLYTLSKNLVPVLDLLIEILSEPSFPEKEFRQTQIVFNQNLKVNNEKTSFVASQLFRKNLFGGSHPYGIEVAEKDANALDIDDLSKHFRQFQNPPLVFVSGKIEDTSLDLMTRAFQQMRTVVQGKPVHSAAEPQPRHHHLERKESIQSSVRIGARSVQRSHPDYVPVLFASHILGGYFGSRLMKNIREEKGLTYGISASIHGLKHDSFLVIGADVNKENVNLTFDEIRKELKRLRTEGISDSELETARNHFIGSLQAEITTPFAHAEKIKTIALYNLRPDHYQNMITGIDAVTAESIMAVSQHHLEEGMFFEVAVG